MFVVQASDLGPLSCRNVGTYAGRLALPHRAACNCFRVVRDTLVAFSPIIYPYHFLTSVTHLPG